ncbi:unnamed protein product [Paramecium sonneborni]|uniref:C2 domain-containing protein n=1 Tax=Paramecium sonneborni TaxID=65129 RepID=A0A8S1NC58_9CILI|nr:unnamed protein product [Paramecium sonneborni]
MNKDEIMKQAVHIFNKLSTDQQQPISKENLLKFLDSQSNQEYDRGLFEQMYEKIIKTGSQQITIQKFITILIEALKSLENKISNIQTQIQKQTKLLEDDKQILNQLQSQEKFNSLKISLDSKIRITVHDANVKFPGNGPIAVILGCDNIIQSTRTVSRQNLVWEEKFEFDIKTGKEEIYIVILDQDLKDRQEIGGQTTINLQDYYDQKPQEKTLELKDKYNVVTYSTIRVRVQWIHSYTKFYNESIQEQSQNIKNLEKDLNEYKTYVKLLILPFEEHKDKPQKNMLSEYSTAQHIQENQLINNTSNLQELKFAFILSLIYLFATIFANLFKTQFLDSIVVFQSLIYYLDNDKLQQQLHIKVISLMLAFSLILDTFWLIIYTKPWISNDVLFFQIEHAFQIYEVITQYILFGIKVNIINLLDYFNLYLCLHLLF